MEKSIKGSLHIDYDHGTIKFVQTNGLELSISLLPASIPKDSDYLQITYMRGTNWSSNCPETIRHYAIETLCKNLLEKEQSISFAERPGTPQYYFIPNTLDYILEELEIISKIKPCNAYFLDVGCGIGNVMSLAKYYGFSPFGIEFDPKLVSRALFPKLSTINPQKQSCGIYEIDALKFEHYGEFDVIYFYCPIKDSELESQLERKIEDDMKVGAYYLTNLKVDRRIRKDERFKMLNPNDSRIYQKVG